MRDKSNKRKNWQVFYELSRKVAGEIHGEFRLNDTAIRRAVMDDHFGYPWNRICNGGKYWLISDVPVGDLIDCIISLGQSSERELIEMNNKSLKMRAAIKKDGELMYDAS